MCSLGTAEKRQFVPEISNYNEDNFYSWEHIAHGNEGTVILAIHKTGKWLLPVAIKTYYNKQAIANRDPEILLLRKIPKHENLIKIIGCILNKKERIESIVMELMRGSLYSVIYNETLVYGCKQACIWIRGIAKGLQHIHKYGIHRDIKPGNILIGYNLNIIKIGDFGSSREISDGPYSAGVGTCQYMAPEMEEENYDFRVDIFSLSVTINEIFARKIPYSELKGLTSFKLGKHVFEKGNRPVIASNLPTALRDVVISGWSKEPSRRPPLSKFIEVAEKLNYRLPNFNDTKNQIILKWRRKEGWHVQLQIGESRHLQLSDISRLVPASSSLRQFVEVVVPSMTNLQICDIGINSFL